METRDGKKDMNGFPVVKHGSKTIQERAGQKNLRNMWDGKHLT